MSVTNIVFLVVGVLAIGGAVADYAWCLYREKESRDGDR